MAGTGLSELESLPLNPELPFLWDAEESGQGQKKRRVITVGSSWIPGKRLGHTQFSLGICGVQATGIADSGSAVSILSKKWLEENAIQVRSRPLYDLYIVGIGKSPLAALEYTELEITLGERKVQIKLVLLPDIPGNPFLLGTDFFRKYKCLINYDNKMLSSNYLGFNTLFSGTNIVNQKDY